MSESPKTPSFVLLTTNASFYPSLLRGVIERPGLYNWIRAFQTEGDDLERMVRLWSEFSNAPQKLNRYDIIHVNLAGGDFGLAFKIREHLDENTKLVVNMDYAVEHMQEKITKTHKSIELIATDIASADLAFGVEPFQVGLMNWLMTATKQEKQCVLIPHPVDCDFLSKPIDKGGMFIPYDQRSDFLGFCWHRYDKQLSIPRTILGNLPKPEGQQGLLRVLFGWRPEGMMIHDSKDMMELVVPMAGWRSYLYILAHCLWGFEYRFHHAASRFVLECASLGIPTVTTDNCFLGGIIWPDLTHKVEDFEGLHQSICNIIQDDSLRMKYAKQGLLKVKEFSLTNSRRRYLTHLYGVPKEEKAEQ